MVPNSRLCVSCFLFVLLTGGLSCRDVIEFTPPDTLEEAIYLEGRLRKGNPSEVSVAVRLVFDFVNNPSFFSGESARLYDEDGRFVELTTRQQGVFRAQIPEDDPDFRVEYGRAYRMTVTLRNGTTYESAFDTLYPVPKPTDLRFERNARTSLDEAGNQQTVEFVQFFTTTPFLTNDTGERSRLMWEFTTMFRQTDESTPRTIGACSGLRGGPKLCYIPLSPVDNYKVLDPNEFTGDGIEDFQVHEEEASTFVFAEGFYLNLWQLSLSEAAYDYWSRVRQSVVRTGTAFEPPAGRVPTNWRKEDQPDADVFGLFYATDGVLNRLYVSPDQAGNPRTICPPSAAGPAPLCQDCLCWSDSSLEKPDWWEEE